MLEDTALYIFLPKWFLLLFQTPAWVPFICALGLFIYQTLDAIDGKQARRTGSSNALGELFDHGCDSLSTVFVTLAGACAMGMGHLPYWMMYQCLMATFLFYIAHWQTYVTGIVCHTVWKIENFPSLRFYVKSIVEILKVQNQPF